MYQILRAFTTDNILTRYCLNKSLETLFIQILNKLGLIYYIPPFVLYRLQILNTIRITKIEYNR